MATAINDIVDSTPAIVIIKGLIASDNMCNTCIIYLVEVAGIEPASKAAPSSSHSQV